MYISKGSNKAVDMTQSAPEFAEGIRKFANVPAGLQRWERECSPAPRTETDADCQACSFPSGLTLSAGILFLQEINQKQAETTGLQPLFTFASAQVFLESAQVSPFTQK